MLRNHGLHESRPHRGGKGNAKCPIAIANLVLLYNKCMEGQYCMGDPLQFDLFASCTKLKGRFLKYCKAFEPRLRSLVPEYRVIPVNEEQSKKLDIASFITECKTKGEIHLNHYRSMSNSSIITRRSASISIASYEAELFAAIADSIAELKDSPAP